MPNWSKNRNRKPPTVQKIKTAQLISPYYEVIFDKKIDNSSKYYREKLPTRLQQYQVANEGQ